MGCDCALVALRGFETEFAATLGGPPWQLKQASIKWGGLGGRLVALPLAARSVNLLVSATSLATMASNSALLDQIAGVARVSATGVRSVPVGKSAGIILKASLASRALAASAPRSPCRRGAAQKCLACRLARSASSSADASK